MIESFASVFQALGRVCTPAAIARHADIPYDEALDQVAVAEHQGLVETDISDAGIAVRLTLDGVSRVYAPRRRRDRPAPERGLPYPRVLREGSAWINAGDSQCPVCLGGSLATSEYCLRCDRWGLDEIDRT